MDSTPLAPLKCTCLVGIQVEEGQQLGVVSWGTPERDTHAQLVTCTASRQLHQEQVSCTGLGDIKHRLVSDVCWG